MARLPKLTHIEKRFRITAKHKDGDFKVEFHPGEAKEVSAQFKKLADYLKLAPSCTVEVDFFF
jgi:hypothetical protein